MSELPPIAIELDPSVGPRILLIEDDLDQRELISEAMRLHFASRPHMRIVTLACGAECLREDLRNYDVVLLDYHLPDMTGMDLLAHILHQRDLPVIFVTGENKASTAAQAIRRGAQDYVVKLGDYLLALPVVVEKNIRQHRLKLENQRLQDQLRQTLEEIRVKNLQLEESLSKLQTAASTDHLTGLANRRTFAELLDHCYSEAVRYGFDLTCVMADLDHYKILNDTLGHQVGDRVLMATAQVIRSHLRTSDAAARYGGDEFVLLLPHTSVEMALNVTERIREQLAQATRAQVPTGRGVTMSIGIASLRSDHPTSADQLVAMADRALYVAKERGKNRIVTHAEIGVIGQTAGA